MAVTIGRIVVGIAIGAVTFGIVSIISLWATVDAATVAIALAVVAGAGVALFVRRADRVLAWSTAGSLATLFVVAFAFGLDSSAVGSVSPAPTTLLRHGGHSAAVAIVVGAVIATAIWSRREPSERSA
ncbi:hypothetical protein [Agromyces sp. GXQ0307]|uniref:hypothetical protein n=1 Tax=Agromyces sp. GXQ0307 TaxID=3377835 RepID=UPI00383B1B4C